MRWKQAVAAGMVGGVIVGAGAWGRAQNPSGGGSAAKTARVETAVLDLTPPERYQVPSVLEPVRQVTIMANADGILRSFPVAIGTLARESQEVAELDRADAKVHLKIAEASVREMMGEVQAAKGRDPSALAIAEARLEGAKARAEIAQLDLDRCTLRAPFSGRLLSTAVSPGQYVAKGTPLAEFADISALRALVPVDRTTVKAGHSIDLLVEGKTLPAKIQAVVPLPETFAVLRELATPWAAALVSVENPAGSFESGQRVRGPSLLDAPIATVAARAVKANASGHNGTVQVVRNDYITNVPVRILGPTGPDRTQVTGPFRANDLVVAESSVPLAAGTFLRFENAEGGVARPVEGHNPNPSESGSVANITPPSPSAGRVAPIGSAGTAPASKPAASKPAAPAPKPAAPASKPAPKGTVPF